MGENHRRRTRREVLVRREETTQLRAEAQRLTKSRTCLHDADALGFGAYLSDGTGRVEQAHGRERPCFTLEIFEIGEAHDHRRRRLANWRREANELFGLGK